MKFKYEEGVTPIDPDEADGLIPSLTTQNELNEWEQVNITIALNKHSFRNYKPEKILDTYFLLDLHKDMFDKTWRWAGKTRTSLKTIGVLAEEIRIKLKSLLDDVTFWIQSNTYSIDEICIRFHHQLVFIHPFSNGNGRHARIAADLLARSLGVAEFTWGSEDLIKKGKARREYISALKNADNNYYKPLLDFSRS